MSVQVYVSGERPRSFPTLAEFVTWVRSTYIECGSAAASSVPSSVHAAGAGAEHGVAVPTPSAVVAAGDSTPDDEEHPPRVIDLMKALEDSLAAVKSAAPKSNRPGTVNPEAAEGGPDRPQEQVRPCPPSSTGSLPTTPSVASTS